MTVVSYPRLPARHAHRLTAGEGEGALVTAEGEGGELAVITPAG